MPRANTTEGALWMAMKNAEQRLATSGRVVPDPALQQYIQKIVCEITETYCDDIRVYVVREPGFGMYMAANGFLSISSGLLLRIANEAQLATILGLQVGHYMRRHTLRHWQEIFGPNEGFLAVLVTAPFSVGYYRRLSQSQTYEADHIGLDLMMKAGYSPAEASKIWHNQITERKTAGEPQPSYLLSEQPSFEDRMQTLQRLIAQAGNKSGKLNKQRYLNHVVSHWPQWLEDELDRADFAKTQALLDRLKQSPGGPGVVWYYQGELYRRRGGEGDLLAAVKALLQAETYMDAPPDTHRSLGLVHWKLAQNQDALASFQRYLNEAPLADDTAMIRHYLKVLGTNS